MPCTIGIGKQDFASLREGNYFYIDKTKLISQWWESGDSVTLITRPRRFGKTLNMSMLDCFFSKRYADRFDLFSGLEIWNEEKYQKLQGTYPVIFLSFADVKQTQYTDAIQMIKSILSDVFKENREIMESDIFTEADRKQYQMVNPMMDHVTAQRALKDLGGYLERYYGKKVIILLDEYDTPMQEAYLNGYWEEFTGFMRSLLNAAFKTNPYLERAVMTGITRVSKESLFSDLNNLRVVTVTSEPYNTCFGFTEEEVFHALDSYGMSAQKEQVKIWYDGFSFGSAKDIYNPWSITNFLDKKEYRTYWVSTSSKLVLRKDPTKLGGFLSTYADACEQSSLLNASASFEMVSRLIQTASPEIKEKMEELIHGKEIVENFDEQIVFHQLDRNEGAIWSLLLASGYLKAVDVEYRGEFMEPWYHLKITNKETSSMFFNLFRGWFEVVRQEYNEFVNALLAGNVKAMTNYMNDVALETFSNFDTGRRASKRTQPERFYHGFVLGLLVSLRDEYQLKSNRESGYGRYDVMLIPKSREKDAIVMEFKVYDEDEEKGLSETVAAALKQIDEKNYDAELLSLGIEKERIRHYGFAFEGKKVLIGKV
mgnify:FL=1